MTQNAENAPTQDDNGAAEKSVPTQTADSAEQDSQTQTEAADDAAGADDTNDAAQNKLESFLSQMLHQSQEVTGEAFRMVGNQLYTDSEAREVMARREERHEERPLTPEEAQLLRERQAVLTVIGDVRRQSSRGQLVEVGARWEETGVVPAHMDLDTFTAFAVDSITAAQQGESFEGSGLPVPMPDEESAEQDAAAIADGTAAGDSATASEDAAAGSGATAGGNVTAGNSTTAGEDVTRAEDVVLDTAAEPADDASDVPAEEEPAADVQEDSTASTVDAQVSADAQVEDGAQEESAVLDYDALPLPPIPNPREAEFAALSPEERQLADVERAGTQEPKILATIHDNLACRDLHFMDGVHGTYLFSDRFMSNNYAKWSLQALDGNDMETLAQNARDESRTYPRPMLAHSLTNPPFSMSYEHVLETFKQMQESGEYPDIKTCTASNGDVYFYSTDFMSPRYAKSLAEYYSVERKMSV